MTMAVWALPSSSVPGSASTPFLALVALDDAMGGFLTAARADTGVVDPLRLDCVRDMVGVEVAAVRAVDLVGLLEEPGCAVVDSLAGRRPAAPAAGVDLIGADMPAGAANGQQGETGDVAVKSAVVVRARI